MIQLFKSWIVISAKHIELPELSYNVLQNHALLFLETSTFLSSENNTSVFSNFMTYLFSIYSGFHAMIKFTKQIDNQSPVILYFYMKRP